MGQHERWFWFKRDRCWYSRRHTEEIELAQTPKKLKQRIMGQHSEGGAGRTQREASYAPKAEQQWQIKNYSKTTTPQTQIDIPREVDGADGQAAPEHVNDLHGQVQAWGGLVQTDAQVSRTWNTNEIIVVDGATNRKRRLGTTNNSNGKGIMDKTTKERILFGLTSKGWWWANAKEQTLGGKQQTTVRHLRH